MMRMELPPRVRAHVQREQRVQCLARALQVIKLHLKQSVTIMQRRKRNVAYTEVFGAPGDG